MIGKFESESRFLIDKNLLIDKMSLYNICVCALIDRKFTKWRVGKSIGSKKVEVEGKQE